MDADDELLARLRRGDEDAFAALVERYHTRIVRLACTFVGGHHTAEDVAQETWLAALRGLDRFEGRSSLRTWLFQICANRARTAGVREHRVVPVDGGGPTVDPGRFDTHGAWSTPPVLPTDAVDDRLTAASLAACALRAIDDLPPAQRQVVTLRDAEGLTSKDVCEVLSISEANQRVLLHRGRAQVRAVLERTRWGA